jgi:hypothetical protein
LALANVEVPCALVSVTEIEVSGAVVVAFWTVNGIVSENWLPYAAELGSAYHVVKTEDSETVAELLDSVTPAAGLKVTAAEIISREVA